MMRRLSFGMIMLTIVLVSSMASAGTVDLSLNPADWDRYPVVLGMTDYNTAPATVTQNGGHLVGTKITATGGTNWILGLQTTPDYNLQNATLRFQWKLNGNGSYAGMYVGTRDTAGVITNSSAFTVAWQYVGYQISNDTWLYTELKFSPTGYDYSYSYTGYGGVDFLHGTAAYGAATWDRLDDGKLFLQLGDNYYPGAYMELAEAYITKPDAGVPEPATMLLLGLGLAGVVSARKKFRK